MKPTRSIQLRVRPEDMERPDWLKSMVRSQTGLDEEECFPVVRKRSIDARKPQVYFELHVDIYGGSYEREVPERALQNVSNKQPVVIIGAGPAGLFAAIQLIEQGFKPVIVERGKDVRERRRDLAAINKDGKVNPESNYCFGEGGAGTYSDGKLYTRSGKKVDVQRVLNTLVNMGATPEILVDTHPHIGTNKLPNVIANIRQAILDCGGEIHFNAKMTDILVENNQVKAIQLKGGDKIATKAIILATGHSARDIFDLFYQKKWKIEAKPFALGVRIEHPQGLIDSIQYKCQGARHELLPAAPYSLVAKNQKKGMFSFCMCPGGFIVPAATDVNEVVVNGMSPSRRDSKFANSGIVVSVDAEDFGTDHPLAGLKYQSAIEQKAFTAGGGTLAAPAQRLTDFMRGKVSSSLPETSYQPGITSTSLSEVLPHAIIQTLKGGFAEFGQKLRGYLTEEAVLVGVESRTSSPVRIPRDRESLQHPQIKGLYPCGEGAGYAGGIVSAAMDGEACAVAAAQWLAAK